MCWNNEGKEEYSSLIVYFRTKKGKNVRIMFKKLYRAHSGSTTQMGSIQFLKHNPHIFAYNIPNIHVRKLNKMNFDNLKCLLVYSN